MMYGFALRLREKNPTGLPVGDSQYEFALWRSVQLVALVNEIPSKELIDIISER